MQDKGRIGVIIQERWAHGTASMSGSSTEPSYEKTNEDDRIRVMKSLSPRDPKGSYRTVRYCSNLDTKKKRILPQPHFSLTLGAWLFLHKFAFYSLTSLAFGCHKPF